MIALEKPEQNHTGTGAVGTVKNCVFNKLEAKWSCRRTQNGLLARAKNDTKSVGAPACRGRTETGRANLLRDRLCVARA